LVGFVSAGPFLIIFFREGEVNRIKLATRRFVNEEEGAALAEYGILVAFIAIVAITAVTFFGSRISAKFSSLGNSFS
jgi:pilus assembly protein Flp/PilA